MDSNWIREIDSDMNSLLINEIDSDLKVNLRKLYWIKSEFAMKIVNLKWVHEEESKLEYNSRKRLFLKIVSIFKRLSGFFQRLPGFF